MRVIIGEGGKLSALFYLAGVLLGLLVVIDANKEQIACVFCNFLRIFLPLYLVDGGVGGVVELQFYDERGLGDIAARNHHEVSIALSRSIFAMDDVLVARPNVGDRQDTGEGVLIVIGEDARVFIMSHVDGPRHCFFISSDGGSKEGF